MCRLDECKVWSMAFLAAYLMGAMWLHHHYVRANLRESYMLRQAIAGLKPP